MHSPDPNMPFWRILKEGNDHFEVTHLEPKVRTARPDRVAFGRGTLAPNGALPELVPTLPMGSVAARNFSARNRFYTARCLRSRNAKPTSIAPKTIE
jgi:hypothetical protein